MGITKPCTHLHPDPSTSTQLISASTQFHPPPPSSFQPPPISLQHPQQYSNQSIARSWAISPNLGRKIQSCPLWLKIGSHGILEVLILNPDLDFWNSDPKIYFWANLGPKRQSCPFCLKIGTHSVSRMLILIPTLVFWISHPKIHFWKNLHQKSQSCPFCLKIGTHVISRMLILIPTLVFWISNPKIPFWANSGQKKSKFSVLPESWHLWYLEDADSYFNICFLNFKPKTNFLWNLGQKSQICSFWMKIGTHGISRMQILIPKLVFWISKPKSIFGQSLAQ